jgi:hypothetical protein
MSALDPQLGVRRRGSRPARYPSHFFNTGERNISFNCRLQPFAAPDSAYLSELEMIFDVLALRDEKLIPALARARAIVRTRKSTA